jgi:hypothetical protein
MLKIKRSFGFVAMWAAAGVASSAAHAYPVSAPLAGPSGLGTIPTTDVVPAGAVDIGLDLERVDPNFGGHVNLLPALSATYGIANRAEIGAVYLREDISAAGVTNNDYAVHGKYRLWEKPESGLAIAAGAHYLHFDAGAGDVTSLYLTGSKELLRRESGQTLRGHLGVLYQRINAIADNHELRPFGGLDYQLSPRVTLAADYTPRQGVARSLYSAVARYQNQAGWGAQIGVGRLGGDTKLFASVVYRFGGVR